MLPGERRRGKPYLDDGDGHMVNPHHGSQRGMGAGGPGWGELKGVTAGQGALERREAGMQAQQKERGLCFYVTQMANMNKMECQLLVRM